MSEDAAFQHIVDGAAELRLNDVDASASAVLKGYGDFARLVQRDLATRVDGARSMGLSWQQVGDALGMTKQAAHERFSAPARP